MDGATFGLLQENHLYSLGALGIVAVLIVTLASSLRDPLSAVPGPWYAKWTDRVAAYHFLKGTKPSYIHGLHQKYGPIVRVGPREVYTMDLADAKIIHSVKNTFSKAGFYRRLTPGVESVFNTTSNDLHRRMRRVLSAPISESGLQVYLPNIQDKVRLAIQRMGEEHETRGVADIWEWWLFMTTDVIGELSFGKSFEMLESRKVNQYVEDLQNIGSAGALRSVFPTLLKYTMKLGLPIPALKESMVRLQRMRGYATQSIHRYQTIVENDGPEASRTVFSKVYKAQGDESMTTKEVTDNAMTYITAGSDTTSNTLTYLVWAVCRHPEIKAELVKELAMLPEDFSYDDLKHLSYLNHVVNETLRRYAAVPAGLPREVPRGGSTLSGHYIPAGYIVTTQAYSMHRNASVFPDPEKFDPSRWENATPEMKTSFMPYGGGSRTCIGLHLANIELLLGAARFFRAFPNATVSTLEGMSDEDMRPQLYFLAGPSGKRCLMNLK
ncbi:cytochrome P450 [Xylariaceae sp. FL1019]|nr:cytochrome P450 [Xylariaceae sp. FL1019]